MKITPFAIDGLVTHFMNRTGPELVKLFNKHGFRDKYDGLGLPDIGKTNGQRPSKTQYVTEHLNQMSAKNDLRAILTEVLNGAAKSVEDIETLNQLLNPEGFSVVQNGDAVSIHGGVVKNMKPVVNEAHFQDIQNRILKALDDAKVSIRVVMAWFTNETLFQKLFQKLNEGIDVQVAIFDDGINKKHGVDVQQLPHVMIKRGQRGGLMHDKFCVIDNQVVITGSYNWSDNAEFRNDENITVEHDTEQATRYSIEYRRLTRPKVNF